MKRKIVEGPIRSKEKSKQKLLNAVGRLLKTKGYTALKVNDIAAMAGLDKKLIYNYFGGTDQLIDEYVLTNDFWSNVTDTPPAKNDGGEAFTKEMLLSQFDYMFKNKEFQRIILWRLSESRKSLKKLTDKQEENGERLFQSVFEPHFGDKTKRYRAITAILVSGLYYINMYQALNGSIFCGLDMKTEEGRNEVKEAINFLVEQTYCNL
jgi:DNA-binding transcriptional regulator YbjK